MDFTSMENFLYAWLGIVLIKNNELAQLFQSSFAITEPHGNWNNSVDV